MEYLQRTIRKRLERAFQTDDGVPSNATTRERAKQAIASALADLGELDLLPASPELRVESDPDDPARVIVHFPSEMIAMLPVSHCPFCRVDRGTVVELCVAHRPPMVELTCTIEVPGDE